ncbi:aldehyde dehydrogenase family protein, partial [Acinetobacter baumannii]
MVETATPVELFIAGRWRPAQGERRFLRQGPLEGATLAAAASLEDAQEAVQAAQEAFWSWAETPPSQRREIL